MKQPNTSLSFSRSIPVFTPDFFVVCPANQIPPFQIVRPTNISGTITVQAITFRGVVVNLHTLLTNPIEIKTLTDGTDRIIWRQIGLFSSQVPGGKYYIKVSDGINTWYSKYIIQFSCDLLIQPPPFSDWFITDDSTPAF